MSLFGTASLNKAVSRYCSAGNSVRLLLQVECGGLRTDSWKYKNKYRLTRLLKLDFENAYRDAV